MQQMVQGVLYRQKKRHSPNIFLQYERHIQSLAMGEVAGHL